jgi:hypothetical protein
MLQVCEDLAFKLVLILWSFRVIWGSAIHPAKIAADVWVELAKEV